MCRIAGYWEQNPSKNPPDRQILARMRDSMQHGGPDAAGAFFEQGDRLGLGHRRLSIIDLTESGAQPMHFERLTVVFNGEIYNHAQIRAELEAEGYQFQSHSDTEVLLKSYHRWGKAAFGKYRGMFAFALWDKQTEKLLLVRDRLGVKPLYLYQKGRTFLFGSELKSLLAYPNFDKEINPEAVGLFLQYGYVPAHCCIYTQVQKIAAGTTLEISADGQTQSSRFWDIHKAYSEKMEVAADYQQVVEQTESLLAESFQLRMVADVPVGAFLSGGVDSSLVVSLLQSKTNQQLRTFTVGFADPNYNEAQHAAKIAQHIGSQHSEIYCNETDFSQLLPQLPHFYDEPFGDSSAVPTFLVAAFAKQSVKVSLSADGGDELFGGYTKYEAAFSYYPRIARQPNWLKKAAKWGLSSVSTEWLERNKGWIPILKNYKQLEHKIPKLLQALEASNELEFFRKSSVYYPAELLQKLLIRPLPNPDLQPIYQLVPFPDRKISAMSLIDIQTYLEGDILTKVDRATMQNALEGREPFLDHKLVEWALSLPDSYKISGKQTKRILRDILYKYVPKELIERPKQGFAVPIEKWLRGLLLPDLEAMSQDAEFCQRMGLHQAELQRLIRQFIQKSGYINPSFIWFLRCLWDWNRLYR